MQRDKNNADNMAKYATVEQIATVLKCTPRWINRLVKEQGFPRESRGKYDLVKCVHWYIDYLKNQNNQDESGNSKSEYEAMREKYKALREEIEFKKEVIGSVISIEDHEIRLEKIVSHIITKLEIIPNKASIRFDLNKETKKGLKELIDEIRDELSDYDKYRLRLRLANNTGSTAKSGRGRKKNTKTTRAKKTTKIK